MLPAPDGRLLLLAMMCVGFLVPHQAGAAEAQYRISEIRVPHSDLTVAAAINQRGQIAGYATLPDFSYVMYLYTAGEFAYPDTLGARWLWVSDIDEAGHFVGSYVPSDGRYHAFAWIDGVTIDLGNLGSGEARGVGIDEHDVAYGQSGHAFAWRNGQMRDLGGWSGYDETWLDQVNASGVAVGHAVLDTPPTSHAFMVDGRRRIRLPTLGGESSTPRAINDQGVVCGWADVAEGKYHAFRYHDGVMTDLGFLPGGNRSEAWAINNPGDIVGLAHTGDGTRAFIVRAGRDVMEDLNSLADAKAQGWRLQGALDINDRGEIVGYGNRGGFLLTPVARTGALAE